MFQSFTNSNTILSDSTIKAKSMPFTKNYIIVTF